MLEEIWSIVMPPLEKSEWPSRKAISWAREHVKQVGTPNLTGVISTVALEKSDFLGKGARETSGYS